MKILGIETSADDTGVALIDAEGEFSTNFRCKVLANLVSTQSIHAEYGGIFPAMAKREHAKNLPLLLEQLRKQYPDRPDAIAVTVGPGLDPCLWQGITAAQELAKKWNVPIVPVNHMEGHIIISLMRDESQISKVKGQSEMQMHDIQFPAIALLISGGHTELILMKEFGTYAYIGRTRDDAVGEAFDKVARLLGLPYPGGPEISRLAAYARREKLPQLLVLPRPMMASKDYDFSFAGLKTAVERYVQSNQLQSLDREKIAREFEDAVTDVLTYKTLRAVEEYGANAVVLGGGVSANKHIRAELKRQLSTVNCTLLVCPPELSTDNGLMIAITGYFRAIRKEFMRPDLLIASGALTLS